MARQVRPVIAAVAGLAALLTAAGCSDPTGGGGGAAGGSITVALAEQPDALDPTVASTYVGRIVFANMCEKLYDVGDGLSLEPQLATDLPEISDDGKTYTISLRDGVEFNDGTPFDAEAVKTTLEHYIDAPESARAAELSAVKTVTAVDPTTVEIELSRPYSPLTAVLADRSGMILSPTQLDKLGKDFGDDPVCVGPFSFTDRPSADQIELDKSKYYYNKDDVQLDHVTFQAVTQPNVRAANLRSGDVQIADRVAPTDVETLKSAGNITVDPVTSLGYQGITVNVANSDGAGSPDNHTVDSPLAQNPELRKAFSLALDRNTINDVVFDGQYVPACGPISPVSPYSPEESCDQDLDQAKQLVDQSGVSTPIPVNLVVEAANSESARLGTVIQSMAKKAGFDVKVQATEFTTALTQAQKGSFDAFQVGWSGRLDPDANIAPFYDDSSTLNYSGAADPEIQHLLTEEQSTTDQDERTQVFSQITDKFAEDNNIIYLYYPTNALAYTDDVQGIEYRADGLIHLTNASVGG